MKKILLSSLALCCCAFAFAQTSYTVKDTVYQTYPFSDPNPIPQTSGVVYPYHRFEKFSFEPQEQSWKMVVLENDYLRVRIFPEIGGKIWSIYDKTQKRELFYDNDVIKFRDIALRGPWTSGGIEFNYGVIGHAPSCAHPVDYEVVKKDDGSVSCYIGVLELLTRTRWTVEINLPADAAWVKTRSFWHNSSGEFQPYYSWANSAVEISDKMELIFPAAYTIGHDGGISPYPLDQKGRDLSRYAEQNFGLDKSYHPGGSHKNYFGIYWPENDFGMLHYALRDEKLGRKYFSWAQSDQGEIWKGLLTDGREQYVELQSGRLFNQNVLESIRTPFKQPLFTPFATDEWNEYWLPFSQIGNVDDMNLRAAVNVETDGKVKEVWIYPVRNLSGELLFKDVAGNVVFSKNVSLNAAEAISEKIVCDRNLAEIFIGGRLLWSSDEQKIDRPDIVNKDFDLNSAQGQAVYGKYLAGMRKYQAAEQCVDRALEKDPSLIPALELKSMLCQRKMQYVQAYDYTGRILAIDAYNPVGNYIGGLAALKLGKINDALDRFEIAAITNELRSAACTMLARVYFIRGEYELAGDYARKSLLGNAHNVTAYEILYQIEPDDSILTAVERLDPLCHFADIERMLDGKMSIHDLDASIREEMKWQNYLEFAAFYSNLGLKDKALKLLEASSEKNILLSLWCAYLKDDASAIAAAESESMDFVFPFREESYAPLAWAVSNGGTWKSRYLLSMLDDFLGYRDEAVKLLDSNDADYAPYYAFRCNLTGNDADIRKAVSLDSEQWRYHQKLAQMHYAGKEYAAAAEVAGNYYLKHKDNFYIGDTYVKSLIALGEYRKADKIICNMRILPFEGQTGSHVMYRDIKLHLAAAAIDKGNYKEAFARIAEAELWPENLGVGRPYDNMIDSTMENWLRAIAYTRQGLSDKAEECLDIVRKSPASERLVPAYEKAVSKPASGKWEKVLPMLDNAEVADKKLFG